MENYSFHNGCAHLCAGLCCGLSALAAGYAIAVVGDVMVRANYHQPDLFVPMVLILIFAEALGLYGLIVTALSAFYLRRLPLMEIVLTFLLLRLLS